MANRIRQTIRYVTASDGVRLAWAEAGHGPHLVKAANWLTHLAFELESPVWRRAEVDVTDLLGQVRVPTLVLHGREDNIVPIEEGRLLASALPNAEFVELDSRNHVLLEREPAWTHFTEAVLEFTGVAPPAAHDEAFATLSSRERDILGELSHGLSNADIAEALGISQKTVRNHLSHLFDKLGVWSRAQAIIFARERGFTRDGADGTDRATRDRVRHAMQRDEDR